MAHETMRRACFRGEGRIEIESAPVPVPRAGELLVRVHACALCGSDRELWARGCDITPGHETAGTVAARGTGTSIPIGTPGAVFLVGFCGECGRCTDGSRGACVRKEFMLGFTRDGGFAQYVTVPERCFLPLDPRLQLDIAVLLLDVVGTAMHALRRAGAVPEPPESAVVMGGGPVGLGCVLALRAVRVSRVVVVELQPFRLDLARALGAEAVPADGGTVNAVRGAVSGDIPLVLEASGHPTAQRQAIELTSPGGRTVVIGHSREPLQLSISRDLIQFERTLLGSEYFDTREHPANQQLILAGELDPMPVITHRMTLEEIEPAYRRFWGGSTGKVLIYPNGMPHG